MNIQPGHLRKLNIFLLLLVVILIPFCIFALLEDAPKNTQDTPKKTLTTSLAFSFEQEKSQYAAIGEPFFKLEEVQSKAKLPDLRSTLVSYGVSCRPDTPKEKTQLLIGIRGIFPPATAQVGEKLYLKYDSRSHYRWNFSENNTPTNVWLELETQGNQAIVLVRMKDAQGNPVEEGRDISYFVLSEMALPATQDALQDWKVGQEKVDHTLLARQKARWFGQDLFLKRFGGDEYAFAKARERIEFEQDANSYACFVKEGDILAFIDDEWQNVNAGEESQGKTILHVKKVGDTSITFDLWDPAGRKKITLDLAKSVDNSAQNSSFDIKLVGAKSRKDWIAELEGKRFTIRTDDWLVVQNASFRPLTTQEEIDAYIHGKIRGQLVILEGTKRIDNQLCLVGTKISENKTGESLLAIPLFKPSSPEMKAKENKTRKKDPDDAEDEEIDDDDVDDEDFDEDDEPSPQQKSSKGHHTGKDENDFAEDEDEEDNDDEESDDYA